MVVHVWVLFFDIVANVFGVELGELERVTAPEAEVDMEEGAGVGGKEDAREDSEVDRLEDAELCREEDAEVDNGEDVELDEDVNG
jgi:hypothetical protein